METVKRIRLALLAFTGVIILGTAGYLLLGFTVMDALYQTVTTVTTVGFREVHPLSTVGKAYTIAVILVGVGTALYAFGVVLEALVEGDLRQYLKGRRMSAQIDGMSGHVIICGWGRVGRSSADYLQSAGHRIVIVDRDPERLTGIGHPFVLGDVTDDQVLDAAGISRAHALLAALDTDADNVYVTLSSRALRPDLVIIARSRNEASKAKLARAGADRVVNPQLIGGRRMATFALQPHVAEFLDVVLHDESLDYRIEELEIGADSPLCGRTISDVKLADRAGVVLLAVRSLGAVAFVANPDPETKLARGTIAIIVGTANQLDQARHMAGA